MPISVKVDTSRSRLDEIAGTLDALPRWLPAMIREHLPPLGQRLEDVMRAVLEPNYYTGELADSITSQYVDDELAVHVYPTAQRGGRYDAGELLELGTAPIPRLPWAPIKAWADYRGIPAFPVWYAIRERGVKPHPFLERTLEVGDATIAETTRRIGSQIVDAILVGTGKETA